jgi:hypothetical protein
MLSALSVSFLKSLTGRALRLEWSESLWCVKYWLVDDLRRVYVS